ncbi:hypothetical protein [Streptosporangium roseum]|uniref:hypothetical protein n=1 Tax=Streptosporangium roseum TaxID=2001 RepID=UPI0018CC55E2|nr:hypothetical protein [Streptosporangium roseum]
MILVLIGSGVVFGISALFDLPWLANVLGGRSITLVGSLFLLVLLGLVAFVVWLVRKIRERQHRLAE